jgi:phage gp29-like protein
VHRPRLKTGIPIRGGLARIAVWAYLFKAYTLKDWMAFVEVYGIPLRLGRYGPGATDEDIRKLLNAVVNLGSDAAAVIHDSMKIDFQNAVEGTGNNDLFKAAAEWWDRQISKLVLGQTASTEGTPGKLGNEDAQDEVRQDLVKADAKHLGNTLNRDLVRPFIDLNFGPQTAYPRIVLHVPDPEDLKQLTEALSRLVPLGLKVEQSVVRDKFALPDPAEDAELLAPPTAPAPPPHRTRPRREPGARA